MDQDRVWQRYIKGDADAKRELLNEHLGLVHFVSRQVARGLAVDMNFDELVSAGTLGLMNALESFDPKRGLAFSTFAAPRIRGAILDELRRQDHVPRSIRRKTREINAARESLARQLSRSATDRETADRLGVDVETLWRWQADVEGATHLSSDSNTTPQDHSSVAPTTEQLVANEESEIENQLNHEQEVDLLRAAIMKLKEQERVVLSLYYYEELKLHEIAEILELSEIRVSQIRSKALSRLRTQMSSLREC